MKTESSRKRLSCRPHLDRVFNSHPPSAVIEPFNIKPGDKVVLVLRVSSCSQERTKNLDDQERRLRLAVKRAGGTVVEVKKKTTSGYNFDQWLYLASFKAQQVGAILLGESTSRFVRNYNYHSTLRPEQGPSVVDLENLRFETRGLRLMTLVDPDADFRQERSEQTKRGLAAKSRRGKRSVGASKPGAIKERRAAMLPKVLELHEQGWSSRDIELETGIGKSTINRWLSDR